MRIGIVGHGVVGSAMVRLFSSRAGHEVVAYDKFLAPFNSPARRDAINACELVFLCVPTPLAADGLSCDISAVEECIGWINPPLCVRSTVVPGTVDRLSAATGKRIAFSPEYVGEQPGHPWRDEGACGFVIVGGPPDLYELVAAAYSSCLPPETKYFHTTARTAELCKYMENCYLAAKVSFVNQFYDIARELGVCFDELRELWLADSRVGASHSMVTEERGFRGRCLPKDISALISVMKPLGGAPLLEAILAYNRAVCGHADQVRREAAQRRV
jgi:UDPglucose 6-dehydrogenase